MKTFLFHPERAGSVATLALKIHAAMPRAPGRLNMDCALSLAGSVARGFSKAGRRKFAFSSPFPFQVVIPENVRQTVSK